MFNFFNVRRLKIQKAWGLHITARHLRGLNIKRRSNGLWKVEALGKVDLPEGVSKEGLIKKLDIFAQCASELRKKAFPLPLKNTGVIVNLPEEHVFSRMIEMPNLKTEEMEEAIRWEAESNIPLPMEKVYLYWEVLPALPAGDKIPVLLSAVSKNVVDELVKSLNLAKLTPLIIESESAALMRSLFFNGSFATADGPFIVLNLKEHYTHIIAFDSRIVKLSTTIENSSKNFDQTIMDAFKITDLEAEKFRQKIGWNDQEELGRKLIEATQNPFSALKRNVESVISFYRNKTDGKEIKSILLTGEKKSKWSFFDRFLEKEMGFPVNWQNNWDPQIWPNKCPFVNPLESEEHNVAIGLALRKYEESMVVPENKIGKKTVISPNLLPRKEEELLQMNMLSDAIMRVLLLGLVFLVFFWAVGVALSLRISGEKEQFSRKLNGEIDSAKIGELKEINRENREIADLVSKIKNYEKESYLWSKFLEELAGVAPPGIVLTQIETLSARPGWVKIGGLATERNKFLGFKEKLEKSVFCEKVESPLSNYVTAEGLKFELEVSLKEWKPIWSGNIPKRPQSTETE
ncbi:MAG: hypothetical protein FJZ04_02895 [Candidatus Moranbacteria bacterium]|nr:hypothetical protein [Candidatus Moranbacteria bacterium]